MSGRWDQPGVPHKGWTCVDVDDVEDDHELCDMCQSQWIRWVHVMRHPDHVDLRVGCVCAEKMSDDYVGPRRRETALKRKSGRRAKWLSRNWRTSKKGNPWLKADGIRVTIFRKGQHWGWSVAKGDEGAVFGSKRYASEDEAKLGAFEEFWTQLNDDP